MRCFGIILIIPSVILNLYGAKYSKQTGRNRSQDRRGLRINRKNQTLFPNNDVGDYRDGRVAAYRTATRCTSLHQELHGHNERFVIKLFCKTKSI